MTSRSRRDPQSTRRVPHGAPNPRSLPQFRREVVALMHASHRISTERGVRLLAKYDKYVRYGWDGNRAPCWVADNIARNEKKVSESGTYPSQRDAERPQEGEVYESRAGARWRVSKVSESRRGKRVTVKRVGYRDAGELQWAPEALKQMKQLKKEAATQIAQAEKHLERVEAIESAAPRPTQGGPARVRGPMTRKAGVDDEPQLSFSQRLFGRDASGRRGLTARDGEGRHRRYFVYVIETARGSDTVFYVGQSWHTPAQRLAQHRAGKAYCQNCKPRKYVKGTRFRLRPDLARFAKGPFLTRKAAELAERKLARLLKSKKLNVEGGH